LIAGEARSDIVRDVSNVDSSPRNRAPGAGSHRTPLHALSAADSAWLRVDHDNNRMIITAVLTLERGVPFAKVQARLVDRLLPYPRLQQRIVTPKFAFGVPHWEDDPDFDIARQTEVVKLDNPADQSELESFVGGLMEQSLPVDRPLWRIYYVEKYVEKYDEKYDERVTAGGRTSDSSSAGAALVVRVHHCIADGIALLRILLSLSDEPPEITFPTAAAEWARSGKRASIARRVALGARTAARSIAHFANFLVSRSDPDTRFSTPLGRTKRAAWSNPIALEDIKQIGRASSGTVNEVLLSAAAGALGRVLEEDPQFESGLELRGVVPVNLRGDEPLSALGNKFGLVFMPMPVGIADSEARLEHVRESMARIKASPEALGWFAMLRALGRVPTWMEALGVELFSRKATLVITSLAGPKQQLHFCGSAIEDVMFWVPCAGNVGLGMSMLSYNGRVRLGVTADVGQLNNPAEITSAFESELRGSTVAGR
jgi:diacylglycerol O-acyltransferase